MYSAMRGGGYKLYHLDLRTGVQVRLSDPRSPAFDGRAHASSDGRKIVFNQQITGEKNTIGIYVIHLPTSLVN